MPRSVDKKGSREHRSRAYLSQKRKFKGTPNYDLHKTEESELHSTSAKKIKLDNNENVEFDTTHGYRFLHYIYVFSILSQFLICKDCMKDVKFTEKSIQGLGFKLVINCKCSSRIINSCPLIKNNYEINRRLIFVMRLLGVGIQGINKNNNESFNSTVWKLAPKHLHSGPQIINIASYLATIIFNEGFFPILKVLELMGVKIGLRAKAFSEYRNRMRIMIAEKRHSSATREKRSAQKKRKSLSAEQYEELEGLIYSPGIAD